MNNQKALFESLGKEGAIVQIIFATKKTYKASPSYENLRFNCFCLLFCDISHLIKAPR